MELDGFPIYQLKERSAAGLLRVLSQPGMPMTVLLHYVGYGYQKRGCPVWLVNALHAWKKAEILKPETLKSEFRSQNLEVSISEFQLSDFSVSAERRLITMFHELYAFGPVWSSSFWTSPVQRWIAKSSARISASCVTNRAASAKWLASVSGKSIEAIPVIPVFSNIGEPEQLPDWNERKPQMMIYGGLSRNGSDCTFAMEAIRKACQTFQIETVIAFGKNPVDPAIGLQVKNVGTLSTIEMTALLLESRVGYLDYFDGYLAKSGIFAAYCAHGLIPLLLRNNHSDPDGLEKGKHFLAADDLPETVCPADQNRMSKRAREWYQSHSIKATSGLIAQKLAPKSNVDVFVEA